MPAQAFVLSTAGATARGRQPILYPTPVSGAWDNRVRKPEEQYAQLPWPTYDIEAYRQGTDTRLSHIASHLPTPGYFRLPPGPYDKVAIAPDFTQGNSMGEWHSKMLGFIGDPAGQDDPTKKSTLVMSSNPTDKQMQHSIRLGHEIHGANNVVFVQDVRFEGRRRAYTGTNGFAPYYDAGAAVWSGIYLYQTRDAMFNRVDTRAMSYGAGNAPETGEASTITHWRSKGTTFVDCDIDGRDLNGQQVASGIGGGGDESDVTYYRCHIHDTAVGGFSNSFTGQYGYNGGSPGGSVTVLKSRIGNISNWFAWTGQYKFTLGGNHEGLKGPQTWEDVDIYHDLITAANPNGTGGASVNDFAFVTQFTDRDMSPIILKNIRSRNRPSIVVQMNYSYAGVRNQQRTLPIVTLDGKTLEPYFTRNLVTFKQADMPGWDPAKHYVLFWLSAPSPLPLPFPGPGLG